MKKKDFLVYALAGRENPQRNWNELAQSLRDKELEFIPIYYKYFGKRDCFVKALNKDFNNKVAWNNLGENMDGEKSV